MAATGMRAACMFSLLLWTVAAQGRELGIGIVFDPDDARYQSKRLDRSFPGHPLGRPRAGAELAIAESEFQLEGAGLRLSLQEVPASGLQETRARIEALAAKGVRHFILDLPGDIVEGLGKSLGRNDLLLFNVSAPEARLRRTACSANLFHTLPDDSMLADATAQYLVSRKWTRVLLLTSPLPEHASLTAAVEHAIKRYGLKVVASRSFKLSNDPRERDMGNVALLTAGTDADVVWVVDADGEFARDVPYRTVQPRPVVGSAGLVPEAWLVSWERYGAPQLSRRFRKTEQRPMASADWAAWMAAKAIIEVALKHPDPRTHRAALRSQDLTLDGFKGARLSFRPWDQQLRQPVMLTHGGIGGGIAAAAPLEGFLHPKNNLDTLGAEEKESPCKLADAGGATGAKGK